MSAALETIEEAIRRSTAWAVFEANDARTWARIRREVEEYLAKGWPAGAYYVRCGLGATMTQADIDRGRIVIEAGVAPEKPGAFRAVRIVQETL